MDIGNGGIRMINTSSKTFEATKKTYKIMHKSKTQDGTKPDARITKKQRRRVLSRAPDAKDNASDANDRV